MMNTEQVLNAALTLPDADRVELVEAILASLQPTDRPPFDESWRDVILRRSEELRSGQVTPIPWCKSRARDEAENVRDSLFHPEAKAEYVESVGWYEERSTRAAERFEAEVERVLERIVADPETFPRYDEARRFAVLDRFPYSVVYEVVADGIYVIAVAHSSRSPGYWQGRR